MPILEFVTIPIYEKELFRTQFQAYLEELDLLVGDPVDPDFNHRFPIYDAFFTESVDKQPFRIFAVNPELPPDIMPKLQIGFFFLNLIRTSDFPKDVPSIINPSRRVASLTDFYIYPQFRKKGIAWDFYSAIIRLATDNDWDVCWECDIRNKPAINFYDKVLVKLKEECHFESTKQLYNKPISNEGIPPAQYFFYQVRFLS
jgi:GNAT superfamily N-acetyltransferase